ncbi:hypothetical protein C7M84_005252 [Penaeus vannamei]|uniref:Glucosylceramidase n=1 Tax=Penaeus vannamei TaxID=6689 RepID=A0A423TIA2_PENVA|nr:hypothetical protein C7M84_005252 [Penaeus vannamei]
MVYFHPAAPTSRPRVSSTTSAREHGGATSRGARTPTPTRRGTWSSAPSPSSRRTRTTKMSSRPDPVIKRRRRCRAAAEAICIAVDGAQWMKTNTTTWATASCEPTCTSPGPTTSSGEEPGLSPIGWKSWTNTQLRESPTGPNSANEPIDGYVPGFFFNCMGWTAEEQRKWVAENLGPTLLQHGYEDVKLMILDDQRYEPGWAENVLSDPELPSTCRASAALVRRPVHGAGATDADARPLPGLLPRHEACEGATPLEVDVALGKWERLESYAHDIIVDMNHWVTGWVDWNLALDMQGGPNWAENFVDAPIIVNKEADEFYKNPMFYAMGHFSKFVKEGATKLGLASEDPKKLDATAFRNPDGSTAVVILNRSANDFEVVLDVEGRGSLRLEVAHRSLHTALFV